MSFVQGEIDPDLEKIELMTSEGLVECTPQEYLDLLKLWRRKSYANEFRSRRTQSKLLNALWEHMIKSQTEEFHEAFANKLLQQSTFEKDLARRLNNIHRNYTVFRDNSERLKNELEIQEKDASALFEESFKVLVQLDQDAFEEKKRLYELHRRLYQEKIRQKMNQLFTMCYETVEDLLEFVFKCSSLREQIREEIPRKTLNEWKEAFYKGVIEKPILKEENLELKLENREMAEGEDRSVEINVKKKDEITLNLADGECEDFMIDQSLHNYLYMTGPWFVEVLLPDIGNVEPDLLITGFIIHRLLETKYPLPPPPPKADMPDYPLKVLLTPLYDNSSLGKLKLMLNNTGIVIIEMPTATNYCIEIYKKEKGLSSIGQTLKEKTDDVKKNIIRKNKKKSMEKKEKSVKEKTKTKEIKSDKNKKGKKEVNVVKEKTDMATQMPSEENVVDTTGHTRAGLLGKLAFEVLHGGGKLTDIHLVNMFMEYVKSLENIKGWVLVNYALSFAQVALLECILGGIQVRIPQSLLATNTRKMSDDMNLKKSNNLDEMPLVDVNLIKEFEGKLEELRKQDIFSKLGMLGEEEETLISEEISLVDTRSEGQSSEISFQTDKTIKELIELRTSKILPRPNKPKYFAEGKSYFTKYIKLSKEKTEISKNRFSEVDSLASYSSVHPFSYYERLGLAEKVLFKRMSFKVLKILTKKITLSDVQSDTTDTDSSIQLNQSMLIPTLDNKSTKSESAHFKSIISTSQSRSAIYARKSLMESVEAGSSRLVKINDESFLVDYAHIPEEFLEIYGENEQILGEDYYLKGEEEEEENEEVVIFPGDPDWEYVELPVPRTLLKGLATVWEVVEQNYLNNIKQILCLQRKLDSKVIPYKIYIRQACDKCINTKDNKQAAVTDFQIMYNYIDNELRSTSDMKSEMHCRVYELFNELSEMCDKKKKLAEVTRKEIISHNWVAHQAYAMANTSVSLIQNELDRYIDTLQILSDYYMGSLQKIPSEKKYEKIIMEKVKYPKSDETGQKNSKTDFKKKLVKSKDKKAGKSKVAKANLYKTVPFNIEVILTNDSFDMPNITNPAHILITNHVEQAVCEIRKTKNNFETTIKGAYVLLLKEQMLKKHLEEEEQKAKLLGNVVFDEKEKAKPDEKKPSQVSENKKSGKKMKKKESMKDKKKPTGQKKGKQKQSPEETETGEKMEIALEKVNSGSSTLLDVQNNVLEEPNNSLFWEWLEAVEDETKRVLFRIKLIESRTKIDLDELLSIMKDVFNEFEQEVTTKYHQEIKNVHLVVNLFKMAIEENQIISPLIVLNQEAFFIEPSILLYPDVDPPPPTPLIEKAGTDFIFTIEQLTNIMEKLKFASPDGITEDSFVTILEDMIIFGNECGDPFIPKGWAELDNFEIRTLISEIFGESVMIDWKDFLIFGLDVRFPTMEELLSAREQLIKYDYENNETINWSNFQQVFLWFEQDIGDTIEADLRFVLIKTFLFKLFRINAKEMNYAAMLMAFCKDEDPIEGFAKALTLAIGKPFITTARDLYKCKDQHYVEAPLVVEYILNQLIHDIVNQCEGLIIKEIESVVSMDRYEWVLNEITKGKLLEQEMIKQKKIELWKIKEETVETIWTSLVPYDMALSILIYFLRFHPLSLDHIYRSFRIADELKKVYLEKGRWNIIRAYHLVESDFMKNIFKNTCCFRSVKLSLLVGAIVKSKHHKLSTEPKIRSKTKSEK